MSIISSIIRKPVSTLIAVVLLSILGLFSLNRLDVSLYPDVDDPGASIYTYYEGVSAEAVEEFVTKPIETAIRGLQDVKRISSSSRAGVSRVRVSFNSANNLDRNMADLQKRVDRVKSSLPKEVGDPLVLTFSGSDSPIGRIMISANRNINDVRQYVDENLLSYFEQVPGVARVEVRGGATKSVFVETSINRLNAFGITLSSIESAIKNNGERTSLGVVTTDTSDISLVLDNKFDNLEDLKNLVIASKTSDSGDPYYVKLQDVADVRLGYDDNAPVGNTLNGKPMVMMYFYKLTGTNIVKVLKDTGLMLDNVKKIAPGDFEFILLDNEARFIENGLKSVGAAAGGGAILAVFILLFFLRNIRSVIVISVSIPVSVLLTFMFMYFGGQSLNFMTLAGLTLGIGMLVDNSVVVLEHIYNKRMKGLRLLSASEYGAREMARPVLTSMLTTILVFSPIILFKNDIELIGPYFSALSFAVVGSVVASYFVAIFFVPVLTSKYVGIYQAQHRGMFRVLDNFFETILVKMNHRYQKIVHFIIDKPIRSFFVIILLAILPIVPFILKPTGFEFIPQFAPESVYIDFDFPNSMDSSEKQEYMQDYVKRTEYIFKKYGLEDGHVIIESGSRYTTVEYIYTQDVTRALHNKILKEYQIFSNIYPGVIIAGNRGGRGSSGKGFSLEVTSNDYDTLRETVTTYKDMIIKNFDGRITNVKDDQEASGLEYNLKVNRELANSYGVSVANLAREISTAVSGKKTNKYKEGASEYDIMLRLNDEDRSHPDLAEQLYIRSSSGTRIPVANLIDKNYTLGVTEIRRANFKRTIIISGSLIPPYSSTEAVSDIRAMLNSMPQDNKVNYFFTGEFKQLAEGSKILLLVFLLAVLFVYGVMASQFESFLDPFMIVATVPLCFSGVLFVYAIAGNPISSFTMVGMVMLSGIAVNHGIVLLDYMNLLRNRGYGLKEAILEACENRLQPILMTTLTTVVGLLPIVLLNLSGAELIKPMALTIVGGLTSSALLSLFYIPLVYFTFSKIKIRVMKKRNAKLLIKEQRTIEYSKKFNKEFSMTETIKGDEK